MKFVKNLIILIMTGFVIISGFVYTMPYIRSTNLCLKIKNGDTESIHNAIKKTNNVNQYSAPLLFRRILNLVDRDIELPLVVACSKGDAATVEILLKKGADPNKYLDGNWSAIEATFANNNSSRLEIARLLIEYGANVDLNGSKITALFREAERMICDKNITLDDEYEEIFFLLIENGAGIYDTKNNSIIHYLSYANQTELLDKLALRYNIPIDTKNAKGQTPLFWAVKAESTETVEYLLSKNVDITVIDAQGKTPYDYALEKSNNKLIEMLKFDDTVS